MKGNLQDQFFGDCWRLGTCKYSHHLICMPVKLPLWSEINGMQGPSWELELPAR